MWRKLKGKGVGGLVLTIIVGNVLGLGVLCCEGMGREMGVEPQAVTVGSCFDLDIDQN